MVSRVREVQQGVTDDRARSDRRDNLALVARPVPVDQWVNPGSGDRRDDRVWEQAASVVLKGKP